MRTVLFRLLIFISFVFKNELFQSRGTGEEACLDVIDSLLDLSKTLRQLKSIPFEITSVQGTSAVFRYSALFPSIPHTQVGMMKSQVSDEKSTFFKIDGTLQHAPLYVSPIESKIFHGFELIEN